MISIKTKSLAVVFALLLFTGLFTAGCGKKAEKAWVNTQSMPGHALKNHSVNSGAKKHSAKIIYLGSSGESSGSNFGPRDVDFEFKSLK